MFEFQKKNSLEERKAEADRILAKYKDRVPIIVELHEENGSIPPFEKNKYLVPRDLTMGQFIYVIRKRTKLTPEQALNVFCNGTIIPTSSLMSEIYKQGAHQDGFLYFSVMGEKTFGKMNAWGEAGV